MKRKDINLTFSIFINIAVYSSIGLSLEVISIILCLIVFGIMILSVVLFSYYNRKGI